MEINATEKKIKQGYGMEVHTPGTAINFFLFKATPAAYGNSRARGQIRAAAASLHHSHSNTGSELHLQPMLQLTATPDP